MGIQLKDLVLGIDIGGTNTKYSLVSSQGKIFDAMSIPTQAERDFDWYIDYLKEHTHKYLVKHNVDPKHVVVGVGLPNYSSQKQLLIAPPNLSWGTRQVAPAFKSIFSDSVFMENDANVAALGEKLWGSAVGLDHFMVITVGTGIGSGIVSHGQLLTGSTGMAGEGGHISVVGNQRPCGCGGRDHFESYCSVVGIKKTYEEQYGKTVRYRDMIDLFRQGDEKTLKVFELTAKKFGFALAQLIVCFSPQKIILAGGGMVAGEVFLKMIESSLNQSIYQPLKKSVQLEVSSISTSEGAILGAAALAMERNLKN